MPLITIEEAAGHVHSEPADTAELTLYTRAAERAAMQFLNRTVYENDAGLAAGQAEADAELAAAQAAWTAAQEASYDTVEARAAALYSARYVYRRDVAAAYEKRQGIVINDDIKIGMLLLLGHLFLNREDVTSQTVTQLPSGARTFLWPYRLGLGI